jgi:hypothetical protein
MRSFFELDWETFPLFALQWEALFVVVEYQEVERFELLQQILMMNQLLVVFEVQRWTQLLVVFELQWKALFVLFGYLVFQNLDLLQQILMMTLLLD